jgi:sporulation-control protein spo0M
MTKERGRNTSPEFPSVFYRLETGIGGWAPIDRRRRGIGGVPSPDLSSRRGCRGVPVGKKERGRNTSPESPSVFYRLETGIGGWAPIDRRRRGIGGVLSPDLSSS